jgi:large subunit ribosomal protein L22
MIEATAKARYLRMSARKVRRVADLVRGMMVDDALDLLKFTPKRAARPLYKTIKSAAANAIAEKGSAKVKAEDMRVVGIQVDGAAILPRIRFQGMGRVYRIRKRTCHVRVKLSDEGRAERREEARAKRRGRRGSRAKKERSTEE